MVAFRAAPGGGRLRCCTQSSSRWQWPWMLLLQAASALDVALKAVPDGLHGSLESCSRWWPYILHSELHWTKFCLFA
ncbi:hypothetical protein Nepgr_007493 [Nepenthes gracilis]|uniref:Uncharacterized protein n=1 Tax=Nepenthes gracilis TaxID=150966 RepID=A0AAD3XIC7_NEPGR|nr:hypothetical protein Nepgr_007493 [Nepenthes gracilis]